MAPAAVYRADILWLVRLQQYGSSRAKRKQVCQADGTKANAKRLKTLKHNSRPLAFPITSHVAHLPVGKSMDPGREAECQCTRVRMFSIPIDGSKATCRWPRSFRSR
jgi:hypothetical protein